MDKEAMQYTGVNPASHVPLVRAVVRRVLWRQGGNAPLGFDDLVGEGCIGLMEATERYDPERGVKFRTYATARIRGAVLDALGAEWRARVQGMLLLDTDALDILGARSVNEEAARYGRDALHAVAALPERDRVLVQGHLVGETFDALARTNGISRVTACRRHKAVLRTLRQRLLRRSHRHEPRHVRLSQQ